MRAALRGLAATVASSRADVLDSAGPACRSSRSPTRIVVECAPSTGDDITFDFTGTDAQRRATSNAVEAVTVSAVAFAIRAVDRSDAPGERRRACARCT